MNTPLQDRINALMYDASQLAQQGKVDAAMDCWRRVLELKPDFPIALNHLGSHAIMRGDMQAARDYLQRAVAIAPNYAMAHAALARVHSLEGNPAGALESLNNAIKADPAAWGAHMEKARQLDAQGRKREAAIAWGAAIAYMPESASQAPHIQSLVSQARRAIAENQADLREFLLGRMGDLLQTGSPRQLERFQHSLDILTGRRDFVTAKPLTLPFPRLPAIPFFEREDFEWTPAVEAAFPDMLRELESLLEQKREFVPYVQTAEGQPKGQFAPLDRNLAWGAYFLWKDGRRIDAQADLCPLTEAALLQHAPLNRVPKRAPVAFFSALRPGTHIPAHNGATNTRLTVHMPLIIPPDCALRVGDETRTWEPGKLVLFDDTIRHEAWNRSNQLRVVLIFDIWHPMLTPLERELVAHTIEGILDFNGQGADLGEL